MKLVTVAVIVLAVVGALGRFAEAQTQDSLLNASYGPTRQVFEVYDGGFEGYWKSKTGRDISVVQSHGGSLEQGNAVLNGLGADTVTLGIECDIAPLAKAGMLRADWASEFPNHSVPYSTPIVFLVRKGNPKGIKDWPDLIRPGVDVVTPRPKTCAGGRWNFLAAWGWAELTQGGKPAARKYVTALYSHTPVLDSSWRGSMTTFVHDGRGDVLIAWENEALAITQGAGSDQYEIIRPPLTIQSEQPIAIVDKNVDKHETRAAATAYLNGLYSVDGQRIAAENFYRPFNTQGVPAALLQVFPKVNEFTFEQAFGSWDTVQKVYFDDGGIFDQIYGKH